MRYALSLLKWFNHLWNANLTPKEEAEQILKYLLLKRSTAHSIEIYLALKTAMACEMKQREAEAQGVVKSVNAIWRNIEKP